MERWLNAGLNCPGCGLTTGDLQLTRPDGLNATGECFDEYASNLLPVIYTGRRHPLYQLVGDAYGCQHPSYAQRRDVQTVALRLMTLNLILCHGQPPESGSALHQQMMRTRPDFFEPLPVPDLTGISTHRDVAQSQSPEAWDQAVWQWATEVWAAWTPIHPRIEEWNQRLVPEAMHRATKPFNRESHDHKQP